jgi:hypothetical protein
MLSAFAVSAAVATAEPNEKSSLIRIQNEGDAGIRLAGIIDNGNHFTAVVEVRNPSDQPMGIAIYSRTAFAGEAYLRDGSGGECQAIANGEPWGSLKPVSDMWLNNSNSYSVVPPNTVNRQTIFFWKQRCVSQISNGTNVSLDGDFIIVFAGRIRHQQLSWSGRNILAPR